MNKKAATVVNCLVLSSLAISCSANNGVVSERVSQAVDKYCSVSPAVREIARQKVAKATIPHTIIIKCEGQF